MRLLLDTFQMLDSVLVRRFQWLFPDGLEWDTAGVERFVQAGLHSLVRVVGSPLSLSGVNLSGVNLADTIMTEVNLDGATLPDGWEDKVWER